MKFDLLPTYVGVQPSVDIHTLNFIWDELWRSNFVNPKNAKQRAEHEERQALMNRMEMLAQRQVEASEAACKADASKVDSLALLKWIVMRIDAAGNNAKIEDLQDVSRIAKDVIKARQGASEQ